MPKDGLKIGKLCRAIASSRQALERSRRERTAAVRQYVGAHWSDEGAERMVFVNLLASYVSIVGHRLIPNAPRVMLSTHSRGMSADVSAAQRWVNEESERMQLVRVLRRFVLDALFSVGIAKVALARTSDAQTSAWHAAAGHPFVQCVDLDDFAFDPACRDFAEAGFLAHRYRAPLDVITGDPLYGKGRKKLTASISRTHNEQGDEKASRLGTGDYGRYEEYQDFVDLWEVYLPQRRIVLTLASDEAGGPSEDEEPLLEQPWVGPYCGPYHFLGFGAVPGNAMPKAPVQDLIDLHMSVNMIYRKLHNQAARRKEVTLVQSTEDGERIRTASDGDMLKSDHPADATFSSIQGIIDKDALALGIHFKDQFSWKGGNLDIMGGLAPQARTATQDQMLNANSTASVAEMQQRVIEAVGGVMEALCWYWWEDPFRVMRTSYKVPGAEEFSVEQEIAPHQRWGKFDELQIRVDPYSMAYRTPEQRLASLDQTVTQILAPLMGLLQQQGVVFDAQKYLAKRSEYTDDPALGEIVSVAEPPQMETQSAGMASGAPKPAQTSREYVRRSLGGESKQGQGATLEALLESGSNGNGQSSGGY